jgi:very-short-patch-repair endonuclease
MDEEELAELLERQDGVIARWQAKDLGATESQIRRRLRRREWAVAHPGVYVNHTGPLTWRQRAWAAVLVAWPAALSHQSALRAADGPGRRQQDDTIHVSIDRTRSLAARYDGVRVHHAAGLDAKVNWKQSPPRVRIEDAVLDVATGAPSISDAIATIADAVQARRTTAERIRTALDGRARIDRRAFLAGVLDDVAAGTCSVLEHGYLDRVERAHGLPVAARQVRDSARGPLYRDVVYEAQRLVVELDGRLFHDNAESRDADLDRDLDAAVDELFTVRLGWGQVFGRPCRTAERIAVLLQRRGWDGVPLPCPGCASPAAGRPAG